MAKLSITFKGMPLQTVDLQNNETSIGRNPSNNVRIDSLAIAEFHAVIRSTPDGFIIEQLQAGSPVLINKKPVTKELLADGDVIVIGKHSLAFSETSGPLMEPAEPEGLPTRTPANEFRPFEGSFQVMNGKHIGMVIPLKATVTHMGKDGSGAVIITKGDDGYTISASSSEVLLTINGEPVEQGEAALMDGDIVRINNSLLQFFLR